MRITPAIIGSAILAITVGFAASSGAAVKHMTSGAASPALIAKGRALIAAQHCNACHAADLKGKPNFSPSLYPTTRPMTHYTEATFVRLLTKGLDEKGKPIGPPMSNACHQTPANAKAIYAYLETLK